MPYFDALTGQLVQPGSPLFFLVLLAMGIGFVLWMKKNPGKFDKLVAAAKAEYEDAVARASRSGPEFIASAKADVAAAKAKLDALLNK